MEPTPIARVPSTRTHVLEVIGNGIVGGMESVVQRLVERLPRDRFKVTAMSAFEGAFNDRLRESGVEVVVVPMPDDPVWPSVQTACALVRSQGIDVIHSHLQNAHALAGLVGNLTGRPVLATVHGRQVSMLDLEIQRAAATHINVVCRYSHLHALGLGIGASHLSCVPNGVDTAVFHPGPRAADGLRHDLGIDNDVHLIGFVGRFSAEKAPEVFVRASLLLSSLLPDAHFVMIGDGPMREAMQAMARRFGISDRLSMPGVRADMPEVYRQLDLLVCTSHSEAMPLAVMEAMATALPVVATCVGGLPDLVEPDGTGWLVAPGDFQGVANRVAHVVETPGERARLGERARARVVSRFNLDASVAAIAGLLSELGSRRAAPSASSPLRGDTPLNATRPAARRSAGAA